MNNPSRLTGAVPSSLTRRAFLAVSAAAVPAISAVAAPQPLRPGRGPMAVGSANGVAAATRAVALMKEGSPPVDSVVAGINIVEQL